MAALSQYEFESRERETCEHCGKPIATAEDGEMNAGDPRLALLCHSNEGLGDLCPSLPPPRDLEDGRACYGDYLRDLAKDQAPVDARKAVR